MTFLFSKTTCLRKISAVINHLAGDCVGRPVGSGTFIMVSGTVTADHLNLQTGPFPGRPPLPLPGIPISPRRSRPCLKPALKSPTGLPWAKSGRSLQLSLASPPQFYLVVWSGGGCSNRVTGSNSVQTGSLPHGDWPTVCSAAPHDRACQPIEGDAAPVSGVCVCRVVRHKGGNRVSTHPNVHLLVQYEHPLCADTRGERGQAWSLSPVQSTSR